VLDRYALGIPRIPLRIGPPPTCAAWGLSAQGTTERSAEDFVQKRVDRRALGTCEPPLQPMRLPRFKRRILRQQSEAEKLGDWRQRESKIGPLRPEIEEAPEWDDGTGPAALEEIRDLHGPPLR
jgi:hypothetical protein